jgi:F1-F0 ATPase (N-ATPase) AtpR subunit
MTWLLSAGIGALLGVVYFSSLWMSVRTLKTGTRGARLQLDRLVRLLLVAAVTVLLCRTLTVQALGLLPGLWLVRGVMLRRIGGQAHARH